MKAKRHKKIALSIPERLSRLEDALRGLNRDVQQSLAGVEEYRRHKIDVLQEDNDRLRAKLLGAGVEQTRSKVNFVQTKPPKKFWWRVW